MLELICNKRISDGEVALLEGHFFSESDFEIHVTQDCDGYTLDSSGNKKVLFKYRRKVIPEELCQLAISHLESPARKKNFNRGASAGLLEISKMPKNVSDIIQTEKFRAKVKFQNDFSKFQIGNVSHSNIVGYYDDTKSKNRFPCRTTKFTRDHPDVWNKCLPLIRFVDDLFKQTVYEKWHAQHSASSKTNFKIENTSFSTITLNYNFQTALHKDKGDYKNGFGNLAVFRRGNWQGNYLGLYQYGICIHIDHGDYLTFDVHEWHCNTDFYNSIHTQTDDKDMRLSMVFYLRESIIKRCNNLEDNSSNFNNPNLIFHKRIYYSHLSEIIELKNYSKGYSLIKDDSFLNSKILYNEFSKNSNLYIGPLQYMAVLEYFIKFFETDSIKQTKFLKCDVHSKLKTMNANYCLIEIFHLCSIYGYSTKFVILTKKNRLIQIDLVN